MAMGTTSILAGKAYRTADDEVRQVKSIDGEIVTYMSVSATHGPGMIARIPHKKLPLEDFAREVESEVAEHG